MADSPFHLFGIRHHGPGCARSLLAALQSLTPDCLLVEGPPEGEDVLPFMTDVALVPPVAMLIFNPDESKEAVFYPFAIFSPEWQALQYGMNKGICTRLMDLPISHSFALKRQQSEEEAKENEKNSAENDETEDNTDEIDESANVVATDPFDWLGLAAGYDSGEAWWNHLVEERSNSLELFQAIREAMVSVRAEAPKRKRSKYEEHREELREASMRKAMRQAQKDGFKKIAVICGAFHLPALENLPSAKADNDLLKALPKTKVSATWVPWSYQNLSFNSGYGAGVLSPQWYEHVWNFSESKSRAIHWLTKAAHLLRSEDIDCSSAHIIEAIRLSEALAAMRERPQTGLEELIEGLRTTVCMGNEAPIRLIERQLIVGSSLGQIPPAVPTIPLQRDLEQQQKSLRLKADAAQKVLDLDLRQENDLARSHFLHRLNLLSIDWGVLNKTGKSSKGSFHEIWAIQWEPQLAIAIIEASRYGNTVCDAATAKVIDTAKENQSLTQVSQLMNSVLLANLPNAVTQVSRTLENLAATTSDILQLLSAIPPLTQIARYGNVRNTDVAMVEHVLIGLVPRTAITLPSACHSLDEEAAKQMRDHIVPAHQAVRLLANENLNTDWLLAISQLANLSNSNGLISGLATRLLFDTQSENNEKITIRFSQALSVGVEPTIAASWLEGFLNNSGMILLHDDVLWQIVNAWLESLHQDHFMRILPLLRRTFSSFNSPERRQLGERANQSGGSIKAVVSHEFNQQRGELMIPLLRKLLGLPS